MAASLLTLNHVRAPLAPAALPKLLPALWRDPHTIPSEELKEIVQRLESACELYPNSPDLRTCLGMAHAMNYDVYKSMDALEAARAIAPAHFWAQFKFSELLYRLRALPKAEQETLQALELAEDSYQAVLARKQLQEIRTLMRAGTQKPAWTKPLAVPAICLLLGTIAICILVVVTK